MVVSQVPHEVGHDSSNDQAGDELEESQDVEWHPRILARGRLCASIKQLEHLVRYVEVKDMEADDLGLNNS